MEKSTKKRFSFIVNGEKKEVYAKCVGKAVKEIITAFPKLKKLSIQQINLVLI